MGINDRHFDSPWEEAFAETMFTTTDEADPIKPFVVDEQDLVQLNPAFDRDLVAKQADEAEIERRRKHSGTSIFLNFDPLFRLHQISGHEGSVIRAVIQ